DAVLHCGASAAAVAFNVHAEQTQLRHLRDKLRGQVRVIEPCGNVRAYATVYELRYGIANFQLLLAEHRGDIEEVCVRHECAYGETADRPGGISVFTFTVANALLPSNKRGASLQRTLRINGGVVSILRAGCLTRAYRDHDLSCAD